MRTTTFTIFSFIILLFPLAGLFSQQKECVTIDWSKHYGGSLQDQANEIRETQDGGFIVAGFSRSSNQDLTQNAGNSDYWIVKLDKDGIIQWQKSFGGSQDDIATAVVQTADGGYFAVGGTTSTNGLVSGNHGQEDVWAIRLDPSGNLLWAKTYGGVKNERAEAVHLTADGGYILSGYSQSSDGDVSGNYGDFDYWLLKLDAAGNIAWESNFGGTLSDFCFDAKQTPDGGYIAAGSTFSTNGDVTANQGFYDYWIVKTDAAGNFQWQKNFGGAGEERAYALDIAADGGVVIAGTTISSSGDVPGNNGSYDYWVMKIDISGNLVWTQTFGGSSEDRAYAVQQTADNGFLVTGLAVSSNGDVSSNYGSKDAWLLKLDENGNLLWEKNLGGTLDDRLYDIRQTTDGGYVGTGFSTSSNNDLDGNYGAQDFWVIRLAPDSLRIDLGNDSTLCAGETLRLDIEDENFTYLWQDGSADTVFTISTAGVYWLEVDKAGCKTRDTIEVAYVSEVPVTLGADTTLCDGQTLVLAPGIPGADYLWQDGSTDETLPVTTAGEYWVSVSKDGCNYLDTLTVVFLKIDFELGKDTLLCDGEKLTLDVTVPNANYLWQDMTTLPAYEIAAPGTYWVQVGQSGCLRSDTINIMYQLRPDSMLAHYNYICENETIVLDVTQPGAAYLWQDGATGRQYRAVRPGVYAVEVTLNGCSFRDSIELQACESCLYVPNAFSPNEDGVNDIFRAYPGCEIFNYQMLVFDRWGTKVFETNQVEEGWDGFFRGKKAAIGTYVYWVSYEILNNGKFIRQEQKGSAGVLR